MGNQIPVRITITRPDDWHLHLRDGASMGSVVAATARVFGRAIIMPNLKPPVTTVDQASAYQARILDALPYDNGAFQPRMTLYLTDQTSPAEIVRAKKANIIGCKLYPAGATTNSDSGVSDIERAYPVLERMQAVGMPLLVHGEVTDPSVDVFDREAVFIDRVLIPLRKRCPGLRFVFEHITTEEAVQYVRDQDEKVAATITAHHLLLNRNSIFAGGIRPHHYCLPVLKRENHRRALVAAATSGNPKFFLGTDSAPHAVGTKERACGCAGCYTAPVALETYTEIFERANALGQLEGFASFHGADFYGLPRNTDTVTLFREPWQVPDSLPFGNDRVIPFRAGETIHWQLAA
jgi:dihydroorotase